MDSIIYEISLRHYRNISTNFLQQELSITMNTPCGKKGVSCLVISDTSLMKTSLLN